MLIAYKGQSLFTLKRRDSDQILGIDFDIFDKSGKRVATIRNGDAVQGNESDYEIIRGADHYTVTQKATGRVVCDIRKKAEAKGAELEISVDMYTPSGFRLQATPIGIIDFRINNGTGIDTALNPLTFILSPGFGGEGRVRGA